MNDSPASMTNASLLSRLKCEDRGGDAWFQFVDRYGSRLYQWSLNRGLQPNDAEDVTQNVLLKIARNIHSFQYDPTQSFRGWLRRLTENAVSDFHRQTTRSKRMSSNIDLLVETSAKEDLLERLNSAFDLELLEYAMDRVRSRIDQRRWLAWKKSAQEQLSGAEIAESLSMPVATVYAARYQVQKLIAAEVEQLEQAAETGT